MIRPTCFPFKEVLKIFQVESKVITTKRNKTQTPVNHAIMTLLIPVKEIYMP